MITDEVTDDSQLLLFNISDMLAQRQTACQDIGNVLGLDVSVKLSQEFNTIGGLENENK